MLFNSLHFLIFFPIVLAVYYIIPQNVRHFWLLISSYFFYMCWNPKYSLLLLTCTVITYLSGLLMDLVRSRPGDENVRVRQKKLIVAAGFIFNLGILFFFKYFNFASDLLFNALGHLGLNASAPKTDVLLPVGISFYTFQALSYTADVYREEIPVERNFIKYALFVSFFPQLVAGPIERSKNLLSELSQARKFDFNSFRDGFLLMMWGYFLKIVLADRIAIVVDTVYNDHDAYPGWYLVIASALFAIQIYCDFAGYSTIATGAAQMLGVKLMDNFSAPYSARSVAEFWRRWHISLTSWFRDYLYIPLGGNRKGELRKWFNILVVFFASGLWHGASLHFVAWGMINGLFQVIGEATLSVRKKIVDLLHLTPQTIGFRIVQTIVTFCLVDFAWIFFRADSIHTANEIIGSIFTANNPWILFDGSVYSLGLDEKNFRLMIAGIIILLLTDLLNRKNIVIRKIIERQDYPVRWICIVSIVMVILTFGIWGSGYDSNNFIYFQF